MDVLFPRKSESSVDRIPRLDSGFRRNDVFALIMCDLPSRSAFLPPLTEKLLKVPGHFYYHGSGLHCPSWRPSSE